MIELAERERQARQARQVWVDIGHALVTFAGIVWALRVLTGQR